MPSTPNEDLSTEKKVKASRLLAPRLGYIRTGPQGTDVFSGQVKNLRTDAGEQFHSLMHTEPLGGHPVARSPEPCIVKAKREGWCMGGER